MNKQKVLKRASRLKPTMDLEGIYIGGLIHEDYCVAFAEVVTDFVHLEERMASVLASLMGASDKISSNFVLQSITSPVARVKVMERLLQDAHINEEKPGVYDDILVEFSAISSQRNRYVHGRWWTSTETGEAVLDSTLDLNDPLRDARVVPLEEIESLSKRITDLQGAIGNHIDPIYEMNNASNVRKV